MSKSKRRPGPKAQLEQSEHRRPTAEPSRAAQRLARLAAPQLVRQRTVSPTGRAGGGQALFISEATVKTHLLRAFGKLGVSDRTAAVTRAIELGMLPAPGATR
jgi:hypothetical protein